MTDHRERAKQVILEILRQSKDGLGRVKLYKAFWLAHLYYFNANPGHLSGWPVVRMPNGPGIDGGNSLLRELCRDGKVEQSKVAAGPFTEDHCRAVSGIDTGLSAAAVSAVREAVAFVEARTPAELSEFSHEQSRSWRELPNGEELNIYTDLMDDEEYEQLDRLTAQAAAAADEIFR